MPRYRSAYILTVAAAGVALPLGPARAGGEADVVAAMECDRANEPGRVRCTIDAHARGDRTVVWADVAILSLPDFVSALKGRVAPADALSREPSDTKWAFGLVAKRSGQGEVRARVRLVTCERRAANASRPPRCEPVIIDAKAQVVVGL